MRFRNSLGLTILSIALSGFATGCSHPGDRGHHVSNTGTLEMPLLGTSPSGQTYRLTGTFHIDGRTTLDLDGSGDTVETELPVGSYTILLEDGWMLTHVLPGGTEEEVSATLASANPVSFTIANHVTTVVVFTFRVDGGNVSMGKGNVRVVLDVDDGLVDDFEDGDAAVLRIGGRDGFLFTFNDGTGTQMPEPGTPALPELVDGNFELHTHGSGFSGYGAGMGASLKNNPAGGTLAYDASGFGGVRFRYISERALRFEIDTTATIPPPDGTCTGSCFDSYGFDLPAAPTWQTVELDFSELSQRGFGDPAPFLPSELHVLKWLFPPDAFDFAVDDVRLVTGSAATGAWSPVIGFPQIPIHAHFLPTKELLFWDVGHGSPTLFDPGTGMFAPTPSPNVEVFCSGHSFLADGRLFVAGGQEHDVNEDGLVTSFAYDPVADTWTRLADMHAGRWYPTNVTLGDGTVLVTSGSITPGVNNQVPEIYDPGSDSFRELPGATRGWELYPMMHLMPDGTVFHTGPDPSTFFVDLSGDGSFVSGPARSTSFNDYGNSVVYDEGKILVVGGGNAPQANAEVIDLSAPTPAWRNVAPMAHARRQQNAVILADGKVLVTGGTSGSGFNNFMGAVREAELWDPDTEAWETLEPQAVARLYHSVSVLLADGRVLSGGGGNPAAENGGTNNPNAEIFSPPYLFRGPRPVIDAAPDHADFGEMINVETPDAGRIARVHLIRLTSVTHSTNMDQRLSRPTFMMTSPSELMVHVSSNPNIVPPGPYFLFLVDTDGVPSEGHVIMIGG